MFLIDGEQQDTEVNPDVADGTEGNDETEEGRILNDGK